MKKLKQLRNAAFHRFSKIDKQDQQYYNTIFIAEYPKCGGSMLIAIIANILLEAEPRKHFSIYSNYAYSYDLNDYSHTINNSDWSRLPLLAKTHLPYNPCLKRVICLYRNPLKAIKSYYMMLKTYNKVVGPDIDSFALSSLGIDKYIAFYKSYLKAPQSTRTAFISYEDIVNQDAHRLQIALKYLAGLRYERSAILKVLDNHSLERAMADEKEYNAIDLRRVSTDIKFVGNRDPGLSYSADVKSLILRKISEELPQLPIYES